MAIVRPQHASSSQFTYHVFLSFRGKDTRKSFTDYLYNALVDAGFSTFRDDDEIERGEDIKSELEKAIRRSRSAIVVFSKNYASSSWCLDELMLILQCRKTYGMVLIPVFYDVDPSTVRWQTGSFSEAFIRHENRFKNEADEKKREYLMNKVKDWRAALTEVANLGGMVLPSEGYESEFIQEVVNEVVNVIDHKMASRVQNVATYLVGMNSRVANVNVWLRDGSTDVGIVALYGMGGVGKTTIAECLFDMNSERFDYSSLLKDIRKFSGQTDGLLRLQRQLLSDILKGKTKNLNKVQDPINKLKDAVGRGRILLVLDDVDHIDQLDTIFGMRKWFHPGSKIIITTRYVQLLKIQEPCEMFAVEGLNSDESLELFSWHAFRDNHPAEGYVEQSNRIIIQCQGLPLALKVLGASLRGKNIDVWKNAVEKLVVIPRSDIHNILKVSYDSLQDDHDQELFLDIACFFSGKDKNYVIGILYYCNYYTTVGIENLVDRCLLVVDKRNKLRMHQLLQHMGKEIIRQKSSKDPAQRSRLWHYKDSFKVLKEESGTKEIEGLALNMKLVAEDELFLRGFNIFSASEVILKTEAFFKMNNLRLLYINYVQLTGGYKHFPKSLRCLCWHGFPLKSFPSEFPLESLVAIDVRNSNIVRLWQGNKFLGLLKFLNLSHCHCLIRTPDFSKLPALERLNLKDCVNLIEIDESIGISGGLRFLNLKDCKSLKKLPKNIGMLKFLEILILSGCSNLAMFPAEEMKKLVSLKAFYADGMCLEPVITSTSGQKTFWYEYILSFLSSPKQNLELPWTSLPQSLVSLSLVACNLSDIAFPEDFCNVSSLKYVNLSNNPIRFLPDCVKGLRGLQYLRLFNCPRLQSVTGLASLQSLDILECPLLENIHFQPNSAMEEFVFPWKCDKLVEFGKYFKFESIENIDTEILNSLGYDSESLKNMTLKLYSIFTHAEIKGPIKGVHESCSGKLFGIFIPGSSVPSQFITTSTEHSSSLSVRVSSSSPDNARIRSLNISFVYQIVRRPEVKFYGYFCIVVHNVSKDTKIIYGPSCYGISEPNEHMTWLTHWKLGNHELEANDDLLISYLLIGQTAFVVKEVGARIVYDDVEVQEDAGFQANGCEIVQQTCASVSDQYVISPDVAPNRYQGSTRIYLFGCCGYSHNYIMDHL